MADKTNDRMPDAVTLSYTDKDHIWFNGEQFISLRRVNKMLAGRGMLMTNHMKLREMAEYQMATFLCQVEQGGFLKDADQSTRFSQWLEWLRAEAVPK